MSVKGQHVVRSIDGRWSVRQSGSERASRVFDRQSDALDYARQKAKKERGELFVHRADGTISVSDSYGKDPFPPSTKR